MLSKAICVMCHDKNRVRSWDRQPAKERDWQRGRIACVALTNSRSSKFYRKVTDNPPCECFYFLEQIISQKRV